MKSVRDCRALIAETSRSPCGERGLKLPLKKSARNRQKSLPVRGAWVEITIGIGIRVDCVCRYL